MKATTAYHWEFKNTGNPEDTESGEGGYQTMVLAFVKWLARVNMNGEIRLRYSRTKPNDTAVNEFDDMLANMFREVESAGSEGVDNHALDPHDPTNH